MTIIVNHIWIIFFYLFEMRSFLEGDETYNFIMYKNLWSYNPLAISDRNTIKVRLIDLKTAKRKKVIHKYFS